MCINAQKWTFRVELTKKTSHCKSRDFLRKRRLKKENIKVELLTAEIVSPVGEKFVIHFSAGSCVRVQTVTQPLVSERTNVNQTPETTSQL